MLLLTTIRKEDTQNVYYMHIRYNLAAWN